MKQDDPVVHRIRTARQRIAERCGHDKHRLFEWAKQIEDQYRDRVVGYERPGKRKD